MAEQYSLVVIEKFKKGTDVRTITTGTQEKVERKHSETKWVGKRGDPYVMPTSEVAAFTQKHRTGIFVPEYKPPTPEELKVKYERQKAQEKFERVREEQKFVKELEKYQEGEKATFTKEQLARVKQLEKEKRIKETLEKQKGVAFKKRLEEFPYEKLKFKTAEAARRVGWKVTERKLKPTLEVGVSPFITKAGVGYWKPKELLPSMITTRPKVEPDLSPGLRKEEIYGRKIVFGTPLEIAGTEFLTIGLPRAKGMLGWAGGFAALRALAPKIAGVVGLGATATYIRPLQEEIAEVGVLRTIAREGPTLGLFAASERVGGGFRARAEPSIQLKEQIKGLPKAEQIMFWKEMKNIEALEIKVKPKITGLEFKVVERLSPKAAKITAKFVKQKKVIVGGSVAERAQLQGVRKIIPHDVDIYSRDPIIHAKELASQLKEGGVKRVSLLEKEGRAEVTIKGEKAIEFHHRKFLIQNIAAVYGYLYMRTRALRRTPEGVEVLGLKAQAKRMLVRGVLEKPEALARFKTIKKSLYMSIPYQTWEGGPPRGLPSIFTSKKASLFLGKPTKPLVDVSLVPKKPYPKRLKGYEYFYEYKKPTPYPTYLGVYPRRALYGTYKPTKYPYPIPKPTKYPYPIPKPTKYPYPIPKPTKYPYISKPKAYPSPISPYKLIGYPPKEYPKYPPLIPPIYPPYKDPPKYPPPILKGMIAPPPARPLPRRKKEDWQRKKKRLPLGFEYFYRHYPLKGFKAFMKPMPKRVRGVL